MAQMNILVPQVGGEYSITGTNSQIVNFTVKPGMSVEAEPGAMVYKSPNMKSGVSCGSCARLCVGESICKAVHTNEGGADAGFLGLTPDFPAKVIPVNLGQTNGKMILKNGSYMASMGDVRVSADCDCNICTACCGGMGCVRQTAIGSGTVFLAAGGTVLTKTLGANDTMIVDTSCLVGYQEDVKISIKRAGGCCTMCCGGEGWFNTKLHGPGLVIVQSMSFENYRLALAPPPPPKKKKHHNI